MPGAAWLRWAVPRCSVAPGNARNRHAPTREFTLDVPLVYKKRGPSAAAQRLANVQNTDQPEYQTQATE
jgi:hypothetical protein